MFRSTGNFDKLLDKATSNLLMEPDWPTILQICDLVRQDDVQPKYVIAALKKKLLSSNPHTSLYALQVLESLVKNCGNVFHEELTLRINCEMLHELAKTTTHENVRNKLLELIQAWTFAFRKNPKHNALKEIMTLMKNEGYKFPILRESDAMFSADSAPEWQDGDVCHRCRTAFNLVQRKHHCRNCGQIFCSQCSQKSTPLPKFGIEKEVRVCDACYDLVTKPSSTTKKSSTTKQEDSELPAEYLNSSLAQQSQLPARKTEEELREEEELQLALALSQSEAEAKEKQKLRGTSMSHPNLKTEVHRERTPSPIEEQAPTNPELARYLNRNYWEKRQTEIDNNRPTSPSAPSTDSVQSNEIKYKENGLSNGEIQDFVNTLKSQVEIFINRMKSNSSRGRSIANDSSVQTLFLNITAMHSQLLRYIQQHDDSRLYYEELQDKLTQVRDARAALDALRDEHREKLRREAEAAEVQRQLQMAHKLDIMRKKKQEYLQYQRQLALQRVQEQEREMQMRQEQQKQQYLMGSAYGNYTGSPVHGQFLPPGNIQGNVFRPYPYMQGVMMDVPPGVQQMGSQNLPPGLSQVPQGLPSGLPQQVQGNLPQQAPPGQQGLPQNIPSQGPPMVISSQGVPAPIMSPQGASNNLQSMPQQTRMPPGIPQQSQMPPGLPQQSQLPPGLSRPSQLPPNIQQTTHSQTTLSAQPPQQGLPQQMPQSLPSLGGPQSITPHGTGAPMNLSQMPQGVGQAAYQQPGAPPASPQVTQSQQNGDAQTAELIILD